MTLGHLEHDIRQLGDVIACQITAAEVVVLVRPGADPDTVGAAVERILLGAASRQHLRVLGGTPSPARFPARRLRVAVAGGASAAMLTAAAVAAAVTGVFRAETPHPTIQLAAPTTSDGATGRRQAVRSPFAHEPGPAAETPAPQAAPTSAPGAPVAAGPQLVVVPLPVELVGAVRRERRPEPAPVPAPPPVSGSAPLPAPPPAPPAPPAPSPAPPAPVPPVVVAPQTAAPSASADDDDAADGADEVESDHADEHRRGGSHPGDRGQGHHHAGSGHHGGGDE